MDSRTPFALPPDHFAMSVGARPLGDEPLIDLDPVAYAADLGLKEQQLDEDHRYYFQALPGSEADQWEAVETVLPALAVAYPTRFILEQDGERWIWRNRLLGKTTLLQLGDCSCLPHAPLDWLGRQVQEDLLLLKGDPAAGFPLEAGQLCFPNHWCLDEKIGLPLLAIHRPVPGYAEQVGRQTDMLLERLRPERPVWRRNWSVVMSEQLNLASHYGEEMNRRKAEVTPANAGQRCYFRTERQTLSRMARGGAVLFTIRTHAAPIAALAADRPWAARFHALLASTPHAMLVYKGIAPYYEALVAYVAAAARI
jgi:hypothetical protein